MNKVPTHLEETQKESMRSIIQENNASQTKGNPRACNHLNTQNHTNGRLKKKRTRIWTILTEIRLIALSLADGISAERLTPANCNIQAEHPT